MTQIFMGNHQQPQQKTPEPQGQVVVNSGDFRRWQPGERVQTSPTVAVKNLIYFGTVVCHPEKSSFVRVLWDDGSNQCHHYSAIVVCNKKRGAASKQIQQVDFQELINKTLNNEE